MSNRRYSAEEVIFQRYFYTDIDPPILINKLGIKEQHLLELKEDEILSAMVVFRPKLNRFTLQEVKALHKHLFSPLYSWAGQLRDYTTGRGVMPFARPELIERFYQSQILTKLKTERYLQESERSYFVQRSAYFINEFNAIHPFIDGNGRITRLFLQDLAEKAGYQLSTDFIEKENWYKAMEVGFLTAKTDLIEQEIQRCFEVEES